jgi:uncharacterized protein (DUF1778 family)
MHVVDLEIRRISAKVVRTLEAAAKVRGISLNDYVLEAFKVAADRAEGSRRMQESRADIVQFVANHPQVPARTIAFLRRKERKSR